MFARGNNRCRIFLDDVDHTTYLGMLGYVVRARGWHCLGYCLMDNHVHLLIETPEPNLGAGMGNLHGLYAQDFNVRRGRSGHLFQGRFGSALMRSDEQLWHTAAYIARNPVASDLCRRPEQWRWSSYRPTVEGDAPDWLAVERLLGYFGRAGGCPRARYVEAVNGHRDPPLARRTRQPIVQTANRRTGGAENEPQFGCKRQTRREVGTQSQRSP